MRKEDRELIFFPLIIFFILSLYLGAFICWVGEYLGNLLSGKGWVGTR